MRRIRKNSIYDRYLSYISAIRTIFLGVVLIAQLVEVADSAVLSGVAEVMSSNPTMGHKIFFSNYRLS